MMRAIVTTGHEFSVIQQAAGLNVVLGFFILTALPVSATAKNEVIDYA